MWKRVSLKSVFLLMANNPTPYSIYTQIVYIYRSCIIDRFYCVAHVTQPAKVRTSKQSKRKAMYELHDLDLYDAATEAELTVVVEARFVKADPIDVREQGEQDGWDIGAMYVLTHFGYREFTSDHFDENDIAEVLEYGGFISIESEEEREEAA